LKGENVAVLALDLGEFVFSCWLVAGEKAACQKRHADSHNYESNGSHNVTSYMVGCILHSGAEADKPKRPDDTARDSG
jgi:hypothetical protein